MALILHIYVMTQKNVPKNVLFVLGTRPEAIKVAPVIKAMQQDDRFRQTLLFTGQHADMVPPILDWFGVSPDYTLNVMAHKQPLAHLSGKLLYGLHTIMEKAKPDIVVCQGDTTTAFLAALTAFYGYDYYVRNETGERRMIEIAHIEAGLRTYDNYAPFPEEANRRLIGHLANYHFAPTQTAAEALHHENITKNVFITGNTEIDALLDTCRQLDATPRAPLAELPADARYVLITGHRRENYGEGFDHICQAIRTLAERHPETYFVYPVHLNRHVQEPVKAQLSGQPNIILTDPAFYPDFIALLRNCHLVLTDSGGIQESAPSLGKPVLVMREVTERPDAVLAGTAKLVGTVAEKIIAETSRLLTDADAYHAMASAVNPYGDGQATQRILNILAGETPPKTPSSSQPPLKGSTEVLSCPLQQHHPDGLKIPTNLLSHVVAMSPFANCNKGRFHGEQHDNLPALPPAFLPQAHPRTNIAVLEQAHFFCFLLGILLQNIYFQITCSHAFAQDLSWHHVSDEVT